MDFIIRAVSFYPLRLENIRVVPDSIDRVLSGAWFPLEEIRHLVRIGLGLGFEVCIG